MKLFSRLQISWVLNAQSYQIVQGKMHAHWQNCSPSGPRCKDGHDTVSYPLARAILSVRRKGESSGYIHMANIFVKLEFHHGTEYIAFSILFRVKYTCSHDRIRHALSSIALRRPCLQLYRTEKIFHVCLPSHSERRKKNHLQLLCLVPTKQQSSTAT